MAKKYGRVPAAVLALAIAVTLAYGQNDGLIDAAKRGDLATVNALIKAGADVNDDKHTPSGNTTALMEASEQGHLDVVEALLAAKADVNARPSKDKNSATALSVAVLSNRVEVVRALLAAGADVNRPYDSANVLYYAAQQRNLEMVKMLLTAKPDLNVRSTISGNTALMWAVSEDQPDIARALIEAGANVNLANDSGVTPLMLAVQGPARLEMAHVILTAYADVDSRNCTVFDAAKTAAKPASSYKHADGTTALGLASSTGNIDAVRALIAAKANVNLKQCDGSTPLSLALQNNHPEIAELLRSAGASE